MDHRIANRTYGAGFLEALPRAAMHMGHCDEMAPAVGQWLRRRDGYPLPQAAGA